MKIDTKIVQANGCPGDPHRAISTPIYQTATFEQEGALGFSEYDYSRSGNPTRTVLEQQLAELERGIRAFAFASGLAALTAVTRLLKPGDEIVVIDDVYGGTCRLFSKILKRSQVTVRYVHGSGVEDFARACSQRTRLIHIETPTNPLLKVVDIAAVAKLAHENDALLCVDNTMLSPYLQNPLTLGADIVIHSATKFLCGHSDVVAGAVIVRDPQLAEEFYLIQNGEGAVLGPFDSYLLLRGIKTLALRVERQQENAERIADFLSNHSAVRQTYYPSLLDKKNFSLHSAQARGNGAVVSFETGSLGLSRQIVESLKLFPITVSFGGLQSSVSLPGRMSHASVPPQVAAERRLPQDLIRLSVGIEDAEDLIADLADALEVAESVSELRASVG
ncbi:MAG: cystathionine beta-lyase [Acidobacteria bacterium]|nr:MAG: cystathionine beta-lyase [Acidobacteriota bacterium]PYY02806.1 MAG: cystathionine beta-lyase [Acidobacteriota bacterium]PYY22314.1 MAG: cystathionine beta-lyase [Acidobacteriota bacterium]